MLCNAVHHDLLSLRKSLTGESELVLKSYEALPSNCVSLSLVIYPPIMLYLRQTTIPMKSNMLFSGTLIVSGACVGLVIATGKQTELGHISTEVQEAKARTVKTPLAQQIDRFTDKLSRIVGVVCALVWCVNIPKFGSPLFSSWIEGALHYTKGAVALGVAAIPEGLPAVITLCLALGNHKSSYQFPQ
jgi:magnesium-transporting ATPase (P-type)